MLRLSNGLRVERVSDPQATRAAALLQVDVGSHQEPDAWPGLAHLLEHLLFAGSRSFSGAQRLMSWLPAQGGRLNATTQGSSTAFFFECAPSQLAEALARLSDMLAAPLLAEEAIRQEISTLDAECQLLSSHQETLCEAALSSAFQPHPWQRFQAGNARHFGSDIAALLAALRQFHQRYYRAPHMTLWLHGPQSDDELGQLAQHHASTFVSEEVALAPLPALRLAPQRDIALQLSGAPRLRLSYLLDGEYQRELTLLRQLLLDEAEGGLMAALRADDLADEARLLLAYRSASQTVVSIELTLADRQQSAAVEGRVLHWLQQLTQLTAQQRQHAAQLADRHFSRLPPMDQLRERAFGFAPVQAADVDLNALLEGLHPARATRLRISDRPLPLRAAQGFPLRYQPGPFKPARRAGPDLRFYPQPGGTVTPTLPVHQALLHHQPGPEQPILLLSPLEALPASWGEILQASLRSLAASCVHQDAALSVSRHQGLWLIQLSASPLLMVSTLSDLIVRLRSLAPQAIAQGKRAHQRQQQARHAGIAVRALLEALPELLQAAGDTPAGNMLPHVAWQATLEGGDAALHQQLAQLLSAFPGAINPAVRALAEPIAPQPEYAIATASPDAALLLFCPLAENSAACLAAWQLLALIYQPAFFQRLRVEQNIGYVVSCRFQQVAGQPGILFALQSPTFSVAQLWQCIDEFLSQMTQQLAAMTAQQLADNQAVLTGSLDSSSQDALVLSLERWQQRQSVAAPLTQGAIAGLGLEWLQHCHLQLCQQRERWWRVSNQLK
jgi:coenzyme PQQ biosynthesis probable peptidase PqqF